MTIRDTRTGKIYENAGWLGHHWVRVWIAPRFHGDAYGYLHFGPGQFVILTA